MLVLVLPVLLVALVVVVGPEVVADVLVADVLVVDVLVAVVVPLPVWLDVVWPPPVLLLELPVLLEHPVSIPDAISVDAETAAPSQPISIRRITSLVRQREIPSARPRRVGHRTPAVCCQRTRSPGHARVPAWTQGLNRARTRPRTKRTVIPTTPSW